MSTCTFLEFDKDSKKIGHWRLKWGERIEHEMTQSDKWNIINEINIMNQTYPHGANFT